MLACRANYPLIRSSLVFEEMDWLDEQSMLTGGIDTVRGNLVEIKINIS